MPWRQRQPRRRQPRWSGGVVVRTMVAQVAVCWSGRMRARKVQEAGVCGGVAPQDVKAKGASGGRPTHALVCGPGSTVHHTAAGKSVCAHLYTAGKVVCAYV
eukprot:1158883-Pelagomonas_calceolata.AAC.15